jgi:hypothetical protein
LAIGQPSQSPTKPPSAYEAARRCRRVAQAEAAKEEQAEKQRQQDAQRRGDAGALVDREPQRRDGERLQHLRLRIGEQRHAGARRLVPQRPAPPPRPTAPDAAAVRSG